MFYMMRSLDSERKKLYYNATVFEAANHDHDDGNVNVTKQKV